MILNINYFGLIAEATECNQETMQVPVPCTVAILTQQLYQQYPILQEKSFRIAVNRRLVVENEVLTASDEVALLPPFAGG
ncbi:MAG: MoaD/ThiS family protein [Aureispira sp.]